MVSNYILMLRKTNHLKFLCFFYYLQLEPHLRQQHRPIRTRHSRPCPSTAVLSRQILHGGEGARPYPAGRRCRWRCGSRSRRVGPTGGGGENHLDFSQAKVAKNSISESKIKIIARNHIHDLSKQLVIKILARNLKL